MSRVKDIWDEGARLYDQIYASNVPYHRSHAVIVDLVPKGRPIAILDLGAGTGLLAQRILDGIPGSHITCLDFSPNMLAQAKKRLAPFAERADFACADITTWTPTSEYDVVVTCNALVYRDIDLRECYAKCARSLASGGILLNSTMVKTDQQTARTALMENMRAVSSSPPSAVLEFSRTTGRDIAHLGPDSLAVVEPIEEHLRLIAAAGLSACCPWQYTAQAVLAGVKGNG